MSDVEPIIVFTSVTVSPDVAFEIFVEEIDRWWRPGPDSWSDLDRAIGMRFERGVGGAGRALKLQADAGMKRA